MREDIKTQGIVLRRTNYGEADRILNIITPVGKISAMAKGARKEKSKLAGGIEMFTLTNFNIHQGRGDLGVVTSAKMVEHYGGVLKDYDRMELAGMILKKVGAAAEHVDSADWFDLTKQCLAEIGKGANLAVVEAWFWLNLMRIGGEEVNLYREANGEVLRAENRYDWSVGDQAFVEREQGEYGADEIKMLRLITGVSLAVAQRIKTEVDLWGKVLNLARIMAKN